MFRLRLYTHISVLTTTVFTMVYTIYKRPTADGALCHLAFTVATAQSLERSRSARITRILIVSAVPPTVTTYCMLTHTMYCTYKRSRSVRITRIFIGSPVPRAVHNTLSVQTVEISPYYTYMHRFSCSPHSTQCTVRTNCKDQSALHVYS